MARVTPSAARAISVSLSFRRVRKNPRPAANSQPELPEAKTVPDDREGCAGDQLSL
jgi:hypothetical protein